MQHIKKRLRPGSNFVIIGYSFGAVVAMEIVHRLELGGRQGVLYLIDGAPDFLKELSQKTMKVEDEKEGFQDLQIKLIERFIDLVSPQQNDMVNFLYYNLYFKYSQSDRNVPVLKFFGIEQLKPNY